MRLIALCAALLVSLTSVACGNESEPSGTQAFDIPSLQTSDITVGAGTQATAGRTVTVHYTGWLYNPNAAGNKGSRFDSSLDRGQPFAFTLGVGQVIRGWDQGVAGMRVGGRRTLLIPSSLGYGSRGSLPAIPPNSGLVFEVELLNVQ